MRTLFALAAALSVTCVQGAPPPAVLLRVKANAQPIEYFIQNVEYQAMLKPKDPLKFDRFDSVVRARQTSVAAPGGVKVTVERRAQDLMIGERVAAKKLQGPATTSVTVSERGERIDPKTDDIGVLIAPVFPEAAVSSGTSWTVELPPSKKLPLPLKVTHVVTGVGPVDGIEAATITSKGSTTGTEPKTGAKVTVFVSSTGSFAVADGAIVNSRSETQFELALPKPGKNGHQTLKRIVWYTVKRTASGPPPSAPPPPTK